MGNAQTVPVPSPSKGIIAVDNLYQSGPFGVESAIWLYNMIPGEYGCRVRPGSVEHAYNILDADGEPGQVRTLALYNSTVEEGDLDVHMAFTDAGIYDVSNGGDVSANLIFPWPTPGGNAGWVSYVNYTNVNGDHFLLICDEVNGYYIYDGTDFTQGTFQGSPAPDPEDLVQVTEWQGRIWFVERNSARAWYLNPLELTGNIAELDVGSRFLKGGHLVQNSAWTLDDGSGLDDRFVMISSSGDILVWKGLDPDLATDFELVGRWFVGEVPAGRRVMSEWGGDITILSSTGIVRLSNLMSDDISAIVKKSRVTYHISRYFRELFRASKSRYGWAMELAASEGIALVTIPDFAIRDVNNTQIVLEANTGSWCMFRDLDMECMNESVLGFHFGTGDGRVMRLDGTSDDVSSENIDAHPIEFSLLTHYSNFNAPGIWKRPQFIRPQWLSNVDPTYGIQVRFDFDIGELHITPIAGDADTSRWNFSNWDEAIWGGTAQNYAEVVGSAGHGRNMAIAIKGSTTSSLTYLGCDLMYDQGGML